MSKPALVPSLSVPSLSKPPASVPASASSAPGGAVAAPGAAASAAVAVLADPRSPRRGRLAQAGALVGLPALLSVLSSREVFSKPLRLQDTTVFQDTTLLSYQRRLDLRRLFSVLTLCMVLGVFGAVAAARDWLVGTTLRAVVFAAVVGIGMAKERIPGLDVPKVAERGLLMVIFLLLGSLVVPALALVGVGERLVAATLLGWVVASASVAAVAQYARRRNELLVGSLAAPCAGTLLLLLTLASVWGSDALPLYKCVLLAMHFVAVAIGVSIELRVVTSASSSSSPSSSADAAPMPTAASLGADETALQVDDFCLDLLALAVRLAMFLTGHSVAAPVTNFATVQLAATRWKTSALRSRTARDAIDRSRASSSDLSVPAAAAVAAFRPKPKGE